ncbi:bifunctional DNA primase/polymerase [Pilimelia columellifera]|uniref:DNA primase/polymerase bifunctional N-terminal domain-containing protein n=1 Tax=Pilimelia columellifera subsp. columellifera TaxID=706583 RepID=A0ABP6ASV5_9ACTN
MSNPLLTAALAYARAGHHVVPLHTPTPGGGCSCWDTDCPSPGKHPRARRGLYAASADVSVVAAWWQRWPSANVALRTGLLMDVCDIDVADARHDITALLDDGCAAGPLVATARGWHLWVSPTGLGSTVGFLPGVDWRGRDALVAVPPSLHAAGVRYRWVRDHRQPIPPCPPRLLAAVRPRPVGLRLSPAVPAGDSSRYAAAALAAEAQRVRCAVPPTAGRSGNRNDTLNRAAFNLGQLIAAGSLDEQIARDQLTEAALSTGLAVGETRRTITSGLTAGQRHPRRRRA